MTEWASALGVIAALSLVVTKLVDLVRNVADRDDDRVGSWVWNIAAFVGGVLIAVVWQLNAIQDLAQMAPMLADKLSTVQGTWGQILTGLVIGGAAGFWHEILSALSSVQNKNDAAAAASR